MALKTFVLINTVNNLSDARYCAGMDVDLIGFNVEEGHSKYINPQTFKELTEWLSGVDFVAEFEGNDLSKIKNALSDYSTDYVMVNHDSLVEPLKAEGLKVIFKTEITSFSDTQADLTVLISEGDKMTAELEKKVAELSANQDVLIGFGLNDKNVELILDQTKAKGIALTGGDEIKPGYKDYDQLADILETLEIDDLA